MKADGPAATPSHETQPDRRPPASRYFALAEAVRIEFEGRPDRERPKDQYAAAFAKVELPNSKAAGPMIGRIASLAAMGQDRFISATTSRSDPGRLHDHGSDSDGLRSRKTGDRRGLMPALAPGDGSADLPSLLLKPSPCGGISAERSGKAAQEHP